MESALQTKSNDNRVPTLADAIDRYVRESNKEIGRTKTQVLKTIKDFDIADKLCASDASDHCVRHLLDPPSGGDHPDRLERPGQGRRVLARDMKNPGQKIGNDVWCDLQEEALAIVEAMPKVAEQIPIFDGRNRRVLHFPALRAAITRQLGEPTDGHWSLSPQALQTYTDA